MLQFADLKYHGQVNIISVVFRPIGVRAFFRLPINSLSGLRLTPGDMEDRELRELERRIAGTEDDALCIALIETFLLKRFAQPAEHNIKRIESAIRLIIFNPTLRRLPVNVAISISRT